MAPPCRLHGARRKPPTLLAGEGGRARLVVLAAEVGGRWNAETAQFLTALARARAQEVPLVLQGRAEAGRSSILACTAALSLCLCWTAALLLAQGSLSLLSKRS